MVQGQILSWRLGHLLEKLLASAWGHSPEVWLWSQWRITHQSCPSRSLGFSDCAIFHRSVSSANYIPYLAIRYRRTLKLMSHLINNHDSMFFYFWEIVTGSQRQATGTNYFTTDIVLWIFGIPILIFIKLIPLTQCDDWKLRTRVHFVDLLPHTTMTLGSILWPPVLSLCYLYILTVTVEISHGCSSFLPHQNTGSVAS